MVGFMDEPFDLMGGHVGGFFDVLMRELDGCFFEIFIDWGQVFMNEGILG
ncbi:MAG: hypothetical protein ACTSWX_15830 [Promethearchaeota archaeon]